MRAKELTEGLKKAPVSVEQLEILFKLMDNPIPAKDAIESISFCLEDDDLTAQILSVNDDEDVRPIISNWLELNVPALLASLKDSGFENKYGFMSPVSKYDLD